MAKARITLTDGTVLDGVSNLAQRPAALYFTDPEAGRRQVLLNDVQQIQIVNESTEAVPPEPFRPLADGDIATLPPEPTG
jgi:hypothetical protein